MGMMLVFHDDDGRVTFTVAGTEVPSGLSAQHIAIPDTDLGDLSAWTVADGVLTLSDMTPFRADAKARVIQWIEQLLARFTADYPSQEILGWAAKLDGARRIVAGDTTSPTTQAIILEAQFRGAPVEAVAAKIIEKGAAYEAIISMTTVVRSEVWKAIEDAENQEQISQALNSAIGRAMTELAKFGISS
jgi:hypothetical protein